MRLIDADALKYWEIDEIGGEYNPYMGCSKEYIDEQPTVQSVPIKQGYWIKDSYLRRCSECNHANCSTDDEGSIIPGNYCPNCGAKMI